MLSLESSYEASPRHHSEVSQLAQCVSGSYSESAALRNIFGDYAIDNARSFGDAG